MTVLCSVAVVTFRVGSVPVGWRCGSAHLLGAGEPAAVEEDGQVDNVPHVVVSIDVGVPQDAVQVLVDGFDDDVRVAGEDGDEGAFGKQDSNCVEHLQDFVLFARVQTVDDDHQPRLMLREAVDGLRHPRH